MDAFPAFFPLAGRSVIVVGEGDAAEARIRLFDGSPSDIVRLNGAAALKSAAYAGAVLAFVAGDDASLLEGAVRAARAAGVPVNVADHPELCDFLTPAVIDRGAVVAAVGTGGASPVLAAMLRNDIEARVPEGAGRLAALLGGLQQEVRAALPDLARRRAFLRRAIDGPAARAAMDGDLEAARRLLRAALAAAAGEGGTAAGRVTVVDGEGPADLLSLRAVRALGQAEAIVADEGCAAEVLALARRDASRVSPAEATPAWLLEKVGADGPVVWLTTPAFRTDRLRMFAEAGLATEILASAAGE